MEAAAMECCRQVGEKLEKSEASRKKLRQAIIMLKEKVDAADKVMLLNATLTQDLERERKEREAAEKSRLALEVDGNSFKEVLSSAISRIDSLEASQANDRKEMQFLRGEVKLAVESVRAAVKATEAAQGACQNLEKNLNTKVNNLSTQLSKASTGGGQSVNLQNGLKAVQATVSAIQKELFSVSSRAAALEKHHAQWDQHAYQQQVQQPSQGQPAKGTAKLSNPQRLPSRAQGTGLHDNSHSRDRFPSPPAGNINSHANERFPSTPTGGIQVIPGIGDILNRPTRTLIKPAPRKAATAKKVDSLVVAETAKDGSDVTVHNECAAAAVPTSGQHMQLLSSITRLFQKEKRAHSKIEAKLSELEKVFSALPSTATAQERDRKRKRKSTTTSGGNREKRAKKSSDGHKPEKMTKGGEQRNEVSQDMVASDDSDVEEVMAPKNNPEGTSQDVSDVREAVAQQSLPGAEEGLSMTQEEFVISDEQLDAEAFSAALVSTKRCFVDDQGKFKPLGACKVAFQEKLSVPGVPIRFLMLILTSSLISMIKLQHSLAREFAAFVFDVVNGAAFDIVLKYLSSFLISGKMQYLVRAPQSISFRSGEATADQIVAVSKFLADVCEISGYCRLLQSITCRILRWCQMDNLLLATVLASLSSVSKRLLSGESLWPRAIRCVASELVAELANSSAEIESLRQQVSVNETVETVVDSALERLLQSSEYPGLDLAKEISIEDLKTEDSEDLPWHLRFYEAAETLELVAFHMGWEWTYNDLIVGRLWSLVAPGAAQLTVAGVAYLLGSLGRQGVGDNLPGVDELRQRLAVILREVTPERGKLALSTRLVAARSLLELSTIDRRNPRWGNDDWVPTDVQVYHPDYVKTVQEWFQSLDAEEQKAVPARLKQRIFVG